MTDNKGLGSTRPVLCVASRDSPAFGSGRSYTELDASSREIRTASGVRSCRSSSASSGECLRRRSRTRVLELYSHSRLADQLPDTLGDVVATQRTRDDGPPARRWRAQTVVRLPIRRP
jgi:hypothetical protein